MPGRLSDAPSRETLSDPSRCGEGAQASRSSGALWRARTRRLYSAGSLSQSSAAWPLRGLELSVVSTSFLTLVSRQVFDSLVRLAQQALQTQQDSGDVVDGAPLVLEDVETDAA